MAKITIKWNKQEFDNYISNQTNKMLKQIGDIVVDNAKLLCPTRSGALKNDIQYATENGSLGIYNTLPYAVYVNLGTRFTNAQPYLENGLVISRTQVNEISVI